MTCELARLRRVCPFRVFAMVLNRMRFSKQEARSMPPRSTLLSVLRMKVRARFLSAKGAIVSGRTSPNMTWTISRLSCRTELDALTDLSSSLDAFTLSPFLPCLSPPHATFDESSSLIAIITTAYDESANAD